MFVVILYGGSGYGCDFLWVWFCVVCMWGVILVSFMFVGDIWLLMGFDVDLDNFRKMVDRVCVDWFIDESCLLMIGMSDGGIFCYVSGFLLFLFFIYLVLILVSFYFMLMEFVDRDRV